MPARAYAAYGLALRCDRAWPGLEPACGPAPAVNVAADSEAGVRARFSAPRGSDRMLRTGDGPVRLVAGTEGDVLLDAWPVGVFHLSRDGAIVAYAGPDPTRPVFARMLLDTVLGTAALLRGHEGLHAAAVAIDGGVVAIAAAQGAGKSRLALALLHHGATLFTDDLLFMTAAPGAIVAHPGPPLVNLPATEPAPGEVLATIGDEQWVAVTRPPAASARLALVVFLDRRPGTGPPRAEPESSPAPLLAHALHSGPDPERQSRRLTLLGQLTETTPMARLHAGCEATPEMLARAVIALVGR